MSRPLQCLDCCPERPRQTVGRIQDDLARIAADPSRNVLERTAAFLVVHNRSEFASCRCGYNELGRSYAQHVAEELRKAGLLKEDSNAGT